MLVLSRKDGQRITLTTQGGEQITLVIDRHNRNAFRVAIDAPQTVKVMRSEVTEKLLPPGKPSTAGQADNGTAWQ